MAANAAFVKKNSFPFKILSDVDGSVTKAFGAVMPNHPEYSRRNTYVISPEGKIEQVLVDVNFAKHPKELLEKLP